MLKKAWDTISNQTLTNCFRKSEITEKDAEKATNDEEDSLKASEDDDIEADPIQDLDADSSILKKDLLIKLTLTSHLTNTSISTLKSAHRTVN